MDRIRIVVADEEALFREGICALLKRHRDIEIVGEATNGKEIIGIVRKLTPDVVLVNIAMPIMDGAEVTRRIRKENSGIKVLLLTQYEEKDRVLTGLKAGANGYIPKRATATDLISAVLTVYRGDYFLYPSVAKTVVSDYLRLVRHPGSPDSYNSLSHREKEVLKLTAEGRKSEEIANLLDISIKTVQVHRASIMKKLGIHNRAELIRYAIRKHLITLDN